MSTPMVDGGMTPMQAIVSTTNTAAECARLGSITGAIEAGKRAGARAVAGDPLADVRSLGAKESFRLIVKDGAAFKDALAG